MATSTKRTSRTTKPPQSAAKSPGTAEAKDRSQAILNGSKPASVPGMTAPPAQDAQVDVAQSPQNVILGPVLRKKELIDKVVERSGMKKKDVKPVVEAVLAELGEALADKRELNLQPMGKLKVRKEKHLPSGRMMIAKIRQPKPD